MGTTYRELFKLYNLIQNGDAGSVEKFLQESTANLNMILPCKGIGVLHLAVGIEPLNKSKKCTELILKYGGDPNLSNDEGITPVHIAAIWGKVDNLKLLIGCGGDPCRHDFDGISAFDYAVREQQWEVYDYLHNVIDESDDFIGSECAYTLDLERILVTTDQMVAEYSVMEDEPKNAVRKSEITRDWCDKNTLVINKLYPTILGDTYALDDTEWNTTSLPKNSNILDDTSSTFKTCLSNKSLEISGIRPLEQALEKRVSVYENFSLPGSPNSIVHKNYKSKTCLKKYKDIEKLESSRIDLDKALAVVQNRTNEWLSSCGDLDEKANTRRSSSSGVSSNLSGSIVLANVQEEYKYEDKKEDVVLIEKRLRCSSVVLPLEESSPDDSAVSLPPSVQFDAQSLRAELLARGCNPGPIVESTKHLYLKKLHALRKAPVAADTGAKSYSIELERALKSDEWMDNLLPYMELQEAIKSDFSQPGKEWREGSCKKSFTYLLLDPRVSNNLPVRAGSQSRLASWVTFVDSIFYIGKGKRSRPYAHLYQALALWRKGFRSSRDAKVHAILEVWASGRGVVCLHVFQNVIPAEAYTHEAALIEAVGLRALRNAQAGRYYGEARAWSATSRRSLGVLLLYKAMLIFLSEGERQLGPADI